MSPARVAELARRVRWFDRYRHGISIALAVIVGSFGLVLVPRALGPDWPAFHARLMVIVGGIMLGFAIEIGLAAALAVWEVEHDRLIRDRGLPRAVLRRHRRK